VRKQFPQSRCRLLKSRFHGTAREDAHKDEIYHFQRMAFGYALIMLMVVFMGIYVTLKVDQLTGINYLVARVDGAMISMGEQLLESLLSQAGFEMKYLISGDQDFHKEFYSKRALFEEPLRSSQP